MVGNILGKGENAGYQMLSKALFFRVVKSQDGVVKSLRFHNISGIIEDIYL